MNATNISSRFLLLPELSEPSISANQPVLRRYSLARLPVAQTDPLPELQQGATRSQD